MTSRFLLAFLLSLAAAAARGAQEKAPAASSGPAAPTTQKGKEEKAKSDLRDWQNQYYSRADGAADSNEAQSHLDAADKVGSVLNRFDRLNAAQRQTYVQRIQNVQQIARDIQSAKDQQDTQGENKLTEKFWTAMDKLANGSVPGASGAASSRSGEGGVPASQAEGLTPGSGSTFGQDAAAGIAQQFMDQGIGGNPAAAVGGGGSASNGGGPSGASPGGTGEAGSGNSPQLGFARELARIVPDDAGAHAMYAAQLLRADHPKEAALEAQAAARLSPEKAWGHTLLAQASYHTGDYARAESSAERALELDPKNAGAASVLRLLGGRGSARDGRDDPARRSRPGGGPAGAAVADDGAGVPAAELPTVRPMRGGAGARTDLKPMAPAAQRTYARLDPQGAARLAADAARLLGEGDLPGAMEAAARALALDPSNPAAAYYMVMSLLKQSRLEEALAAADKALALSPKDARLWAARASVHNALKRHAEALRDADRALQLDPKQARALIDKAWALDALGRRTEALAALKAAAALDLKYQELYDKAQGFRDGELALYLSGGKVGAREEKEGTEEGDAPRPGRLVVLALVMTAGAALVAAGFLLGKRA